MFEGMLFCIAADSPLRKVQITSMTHNERDGVSNHQPHDCLLNGLFRRRSNKTSKLRVTGLCEGNSPVTSEFLVQRAGNVGNVSYDASWIWSAVFVCNGILTTRRSKIRLSEKSLFQKQLTEDRHSSCVRTVNGCFWRIRSLAKVWPSNFLHCV